jgi:hypothetical protein
MQHNALFCFTRGCSLKKERDNGYTLTPAAAAAAAVAQCSGAHRGN